MRYEEKGDADEGGANPTTPTTTPHAGEGASAAPVPSPEVDGVMVTKMAVEGANEHGVAELSLEEGAAVQVHAGKKLAGRCHLDDRKDGHADRAGSARVRPNTVFGVSARASALREHPARAAAAAAATACTRVSVANDSRRSRQLTLVLSRPPEIVLWHHRCVGHLLN